MAQSHGGYRNGREIAMPAHLTHRRRGDEKKVGIRSLLFPDMYALLVVLQCAEQRSAAQRRGFFLGASHSGHAEYGNMGGAG